MIEIERLFLAAMGFNNDSVWFLLPLFLVMCKSTFFVCRFTMCMDVYLELFPLHLIQKIVFYVSPTHYFPKLNAVSKALSTTFQK